jgi:hypothetical protein
MAENNPHHRQGGRGYSPLLRITGDYITEAVAPIYPPEAGAH